jgi:hypothetical protein
VTTGYGVTVEIPGVGLTPTSLDIEEDLTFQEWERLLGIMERYEKSSPWWVGDCLAFGHEVWGDRIYQSLTEVGWRNERLRQYRWVAERVAPQHRNPDLSWSHHRQVAALDNPKDQVRWLDTALAEGWTERELSVRMDAEPDTRAASAPPPETLYDWALKYRKAATVLVGVLRAGYTASAEELASDIESSLE